MNSRSLFAVAELLVFSRCCCTFQRICF